MAKITVPNYIRFDPCLLLGESLFRSSFGKLSVMDKLHQLALEQHSAEWDWGLEQEFTDEQQDLKAVESYRVLIGEDAVQ